jgi:hypothetical protein
MEKQSQQPEKHYREAEGNLDSPVNTKDAHDFGKQSLTDDESAETDPNEVANKATFRNKEDKTNPDRFDGEIKI